MVVLHMKLFTIYMQDLNAMGIVCLRSDVRSEQRRNIRHRLIKRVCFPLSLFEMREAVIICFLLNLHMGEQNCPRRTLLLGQISPEGTNLVTTPVLW